MFCPKCGGVELETAKNDKLEYLACINGCEGVWVLKSDLEKYWGKKKFKQLESELEEVKQPDFEKEAVVAEKEAVDIDEPVEEEEDLYLDEDVDDFEEDDEDDSYDEDYDDSGDYEDLDEKTEEEDDEEDIEEVSFGNQRTLKRSLIDEGEVEDEVVDSGEGFSSETELIEEEEEDLIHNDDEETMFLTSPISGNPMKKFSVKVKDKIKCIIAKCPDSGGYWIDAAEEVMAVIADKSGNPPKNFADLLNYERPEEEVFEDDEEDEDSEDI